MNAAAPLACSVRGCGEPLEPRDRALVCPRSHAFDVARSGYVNLLQPHDRRSLAAGDSLGAIDARMRTLDAGVGRAAIDAVVGQALAPGLEADAVVVDLGCGAGDLLDALHRQSATATGGPITVGIDLSAAAIDRAARRFPHATWIVANADRRLPLLDASARLVLSLHGRRNAPECARVLGSGGYLVVAVPGPADLGELRGSVQGAIATRDRTGVLIAEHEPFFELCGRARATEHHRLNRDLLRDLLHGTYRGLRRSAAERIEAVDQLDVTLESDICVFRRR